MADPFRLTVVCTGNICRSPMAEVVLRRRFAEAGLGDRVEVDSRGVSAEEEGNPVDPRAARVLREAGYAVPDHVARRITRNEVRAADLVLAATRQHAARLLALAPDAAERVHLLRSYDRAEDRGSPPDLADPWYGDAEDFRRCLAEIEASADGIVDEVRSALG